MTRPRGRPPIPDDPEVALLSPRREAIFRLIQSEPGLSLTEIRTRLEIPSGAFYNHIEKLLASGLVEKRTNGRQERVFPSDAAPAPDAPALSSDNAKAVARLLLERPGLSSFAVGEALGFSQRTAQAHIRNLLWAGYVTQEKGGRTAAYFPTARLAEEFARN